MHTDWDDGANTAEEMILASEAAGLTSVGVSLHSPLPGPNAWGPRADCIPAYLSRMHALARQYAGRITVYTGIEWDTASQVDLAPYDYVIGSVHQLPLPGDPSIDESAETTARMLELCGGADALAELFFAAYGRVADNPQVQIVGHFDLLTKFDERRGFFDPQSPRYRRAAQEAMERLVAADKIFEVNTGAISRGYRTSPYPSRELLLQLRRMGGRATVGADAHHIGGVTCAFDQAQALLRACGFAEIWVLEGKKFVPEPL